MKKSNVRDALEEIQTYYEVTRKRGHTHGMLCGANNIENPVILSSTNECAKHLKSTKVTNHSAITRSIYGASPLRGMNRPLFLDNDALWVLCRDAVKEIDKLRSEVAQLKKRK